MFTMIISVLALTDCDITMYCQLAATIPGGSKNVPLNKMQFLDN